MGEITIQESQRTIRSKSIVLDHVLRLPMAARLHRGLRTVCDVCRKPITDEFFYGGFSARRLRRSGSLWRRGRWEGRVAPMPDNQSKTKGTTYLTPLE